MKRRCWAWPSSSPATAQPEAVLAAAAAAWALDVPADLICAGLRTFDPPRMPPKAQNKSAPGPVGAGSPLKEGLWKYHAYGPCAAPTSGATTPRSRRSSPARRKKNRSATLPGFEARLRALFPQIWPLQPRP
jgi:hypothetical protein